MKTLTILPQTSRRLFDLSIRCLTTPPPGTQTKDTPIGSEFKSFYHKDLIIQQAQGDQLRKKPEEGEALKFGHNYADHMVDIDWTDTKGWGKPVIKPLQDLKIHPGSKVLHYAVELFEGMKAYRGFDNRIRLFRPEKNMERMRKTARRSALPDFDSEELIKIIEETVRLDKEWVPSSATSSLYIRPTFIGTDPTLGVGDPHMAKLFVLTGPVGQYYATGFQPITLLADAKYIRAFPGGVGAYKMGCNYAPTIHVGKVAADMGCQQVLWLHGEEEQLTEVGTMNIFVLWKNKQGEVELVTPPLEKGLILPGVTRLSLLELAREWNEFKVSERFVSMFEIREALKEKRLMEVFGAGTACVVSPVGRILHHNIKTDQFDELIIPTMENKPNLMQKFYELINDIQYGRKHKAGWTRVIQTE